MDNLIFISHFMDTKKNLWGCGHPRGNKKKKLSTANHTSNNGHHHLNLATALIKFVKKRYSSFTAKKTKRKRPSHSQEKKHPRKPKTAMAAVTDGANLVTLQDWMSVELNTAGANSGEFHVFNKQVSAAAAYKKKIHPSFDRSSHNADDTSYSKKNSRRDQQIMEKLITVDGGAAEVEAEVASLPPLQSSGDTAKKKVSFRLPLVTNIFIFGTSPELTE